MSAVPDAAISICHNPECGTSRNTLRHIRNSGVEPVVVECLKVPPGRAERVDLMAAMGVPVCSVLRRKGTPYDELKLGDPSWTDAQLIDFVALHPILMNRPIVITPLGTRLCRPSEVVLDLLPIPQPGPLTKEDVEVVIDMKGIRVSP